MSPRASLETGRVRVLLIGDIEITSVYLVDDPFFEVSLVPALSQGGYGFSNELIQRAIRLYMPRTYVDLVEKYDVISLNYATAWHFELAMTQQLADGVRDGGLGLFLTGGGISFHDWYMTTLGEVLPVEMEAQASPGRFSPPARLRILKPEHPLMASLPWSRIGQHGTFFTSTLVNPRLGSETLADLVPTGHHSYTNPCFVWWDMGQGRSFTMTGILKPSVSMEFFQWEFYPDWSSNLHLFLADQDIPPDIFILHEIRLRLGNCHNLRGMLISFYDFISRMGGSTMRLDHEMGEVDEKLKIIGSAYLAYDFDESLKLVNQLTQDLGEAMDLAVRAKNEALFWIYMIEWLIVTATILAAGTLVWSIMIRRHLYSEVRTTRLTKATV
jgi:uncharacterized membrane protein